MTKQLVVYNDALKRFVLMPNEEELPTKSTQISPLPGNAIKRASDSTLWVSAIHHMEWVGITGSLVIHLTDGTSHSVTLPVGATANNSRPPDFEWVANSDGEQIVTLPYTPMLVGHALFLNGVKQSVESYTIASNTLTVSADLLVKATDNLTFSGIQF